LLRNFSPLKWWSRQSVRPGPKKYRLYVIEGQGPQSAELVSLLKAHPGFDFTDLSIADARLAGGSREKAAVLARRGIGAADAVLVLTTPPARNAAWIRYQLDAAERCGAHVVGVTPKATAVSSLVRTAANRIAGWDAGQIVAAILGRRAAPAGANATAATAKPARGTPLQVPVSVSPATVPAFVAPKPVAEPAKPASPAKSGSLFARLFGRGAAKAL
jgi:hypothetical protein